MSEFVAVALIALAPGDSLPAALVAVDGPAVAYTVAQYMDSTVTAWRILGDWQPGAIVESPGEGEVLVLFVPRAGESATGVGETPADDGVEELPPSLPDTPGTGCGRIVSWD